MEKIQFHSHIGLLTHLAGMHYVFIPADIVQKCGGIGNTRWVCTVNKTLRWQGGFTALKDGAAYISISKAKMKKAGLSEGDEIQVLLETDKSEYGMDMPAELSHVLATDPEGLRRFEMLSPGKKRYIIRYVSSVKNQDKRIERALLLIGNLKQLKEGRESFSEMLGLPRYR